MVDGNGTTTYAYTAAGINGAGQIASIDGPFSNDTITYAYDELARVLTRLLNGTGTEIAYDALGRVSQLEFPIGEFDYTYVGQTGRVNTVTYPNNQTTTYSYFNDQQDFRLQTIHHKNPSAATLSKFDYTYDDVGNMLTWRQERAGSAAKMYTFTHDLVDQLTSAVLADASNPATILKRQAWSYDVAGNRTVDQADDAVFASTHDNLNRLGSRAPGGPIVFAGALNEGGTVTIDGKSATVDAVNNFRGTVTLSGATTTVTVKAKDYSGNETTRQYEVDAAGSTTSYTYDANGNLMSDGTKTYYWNALNQLIEVKEGSTTIATFEYDGAARRTQKVAAGLTHQYIYDAEDIVEERISGLSADTLRYYHGSGIDEPLARKNSSDVPTYYLADHLGSIIQETNGSGAVTLEREYDPWGGAMQGAEACGYAFTGREWDAETGLYLYRARYYSAAMATFLSEDPIGLAGGTNLSTYVFNSPTRFTDPYGLDAHINVVGNKIHITIPIIFEGPGATPQVIDKFTNAIVKEWSEQFGPFTVETRVTTGPANRVYVPLGDGRATATSNRGNWPAERPGWTAAHEAGHFMGLKDRYDYQSGRPDPGWEGNIMAEQGGKVRVDNIFNILGSCPRVGAR